MIFAFFQIDDVQGKAIGSNGLLNIELRDVRPHLGGDVDGYGERTRKRSLGQSLTSTIG